MTKKPTNLAVFLYGKTEYFRTAFFEGLDALRKDGPAFHPLPSRDEIEKEIRAIDKVKK
jgi:hypothetical protein